MPTRNPIPIARAKRLRSDLTEAEKVLWRAVRAKRFADTKFTRQVPIGPYIADFAARQARLIIELNGGQHALAAEADAARTAFLESQGYRVIRFWNNDVLPNIEGVPIRIAEALNQPPLPTPPPAGGREQD